MKANPDELCSPRRQVFGFVFTTCFREGRKGQWGCVLWPTGRPLQSFRSSVPQLSAAARTHRVALGTTERKVAALQTAV